MMNIIKMLKANPKKKAALKEEAHPPLTQVDLSARVGNLPMESREWSSIPVGISNGDLINHINLNHTLLIADSDDDRELFLQTLYHFYLTAPDGEESFADAGLVEFHTSVDTVYERLSARRDFLIKGVNTDIFFPDGSFAPTKQMPLIVLTVQLNMSPEKLKQILVLGRSCGVYVVATPNLDERFAFPSVPERRLADYFGTVAIVNKEIAYPLFGELKPCDDPVKVFNETVNSLMNSSYEVPPVLFLWNGLFDRRSVYLFSTEEENKVFPSSR